MLTEDDLRVAFRGMERHTPDAADVLRAVYDHPRRSSPSWRRCSVCRGGSRLRAALALVHRRGVAAVAVIGQG